MTAYDHEYFNVSFPDHHVALVEINRPEKLNAFVEIMWLSLAAIFRKLSHDPEVRVVLLTAAGDKAFTAGLDVQAAAEGPLHASNSMDVARKANAIRRHVAEFQECITAIEKCEKPVVALLYGITYGLGIDISLACDIRLCTSTTRFSVKEVDIGLAADIGTLSRLPHSGVPMSFVKDVCLSARDFTAAEAERVGLVSGVEASKQDLLERGLSMGKLLASKSPVAVVGTKEIINFSRDHGVADGLQYTAVWNAGYSQSQDLQDALLAGMQRRKPTFSKL